MFLKKMTTLGLSAVLALSAFTSLYSAEHIAPKRTTQCFTPEKIDELTKKFASTEMQERLKKLKQQRDQILDDDSLAVFQGWWQNTTRGNVLGFGNVRFGSATSDLDSYIFLDTETYAQYGVVQISTLAGTPYLPREFTNLDYGDTQAPLPFFFSFYYVASPTELVSVFDVDGPLFDPTNFASSWSLKLQPDSQTLATCFDSRPETTGLFTFSCVFKKIDAPLQPIRPFDDTNSAFPDVTNPVVMAEYIYNALTLNHLEAENIHFNDRDYRSFYEREAIFTQLLDEGFTYKTPIRRIRVSQPGEHFLTERGVAGEPNSGMISTDIVTDIFTDGFSYATTGATVEIGGFKGLWARLNGTYVNGVAIAESGAIPNPSPTHVDVNESQTQGTFCNVYNHFLLDFDSSNAKKFPRDSQGWAEEIEGNPYVKVTHRITPDTEYPAFFAAMQAMFYKMYQVSQHTARYSARFKPGSIFLFDTFQEMKENVAITNYWANASFPGDNVIRTRTNQAIPSGFFNNVTMADRGCTTYNDPFRLTQKPGSRFDYNIVMTNYLDQKSIKNLYWAISGTPATNPGDPTAPNGAFLQFDPTEVGYKPAIPGPQRAEFVGALGDVTVVNGKPVPHFPSVDPSGVYYSLLADLVAPPADDAFLSNAYYVGLIDSKLTHGKRVGYLRWLDEGAFDPLLFMSTSTFPPVAAELPPSQGGTNVRYGREAMSQVFSQYTRYFNQQACDAIIIDIRSNNGGLVESMFAIAEFMGDDRVATSQLWSKKDNGNSALLDLANTSEYTFFQEVQAGNSASFANFYVQQNASTYGANTIFRGTACKPKKVIILTDYGAASAGDVIPHYFLGENLDGNLGSYTTGIILGDIDGRLKGYSSNFSAVPVSEFSNQLYDANGNPFAPIRYTADLAGGIFYNGVTGIPYNIQSDLIAPSKAPSLHGAAGGNPLPNDWSTNTWPALGFVPAPKGLFSSEIPKGKPKPHVQESWRDPSLEQAILVAIGVEPDSSSSSSSSSS